ncbi:MAG: hypothetical protein CMN79_04385 [Spirochaetales bacterium]|nr:hypothetical protein [Spirochaetales bacterium]
MELNLKNKTIIVSGSSKGIGKNIANLLLKEGSNVVINGRNKITLTQTFKELNSEFNGNLVAIPGDVSKSSVVNKIRKTTIKKWGKIDGIVANASTLKNLKNIDKFNKASGWLMKYNFEMVYNLVDNLTPYIKSKESSIVVIGSIAGIEDIGAPIYYSVYKSSLSAYVKTMSRELSKKNIRINLISPGNILFSKGNWEKRIEKNKTKIKNMIKKNVPLKKFGKPEDISVMVAMLLSNKTQFITGSNFVIDGGQTRSIR